MSMAIDDGAAPGDAQPWNSDEPAENESLCLFEGDLGQLAAEVRRALVVILKKRYVSAERDPDVWRILVENRIALETRLNDMFLHLVVDRDYDVAYKRQAVPDGEGTFPTLLRNAAYSREQTILMVHLRGVFRSGLSDGAEAVFVDSQELIDEVANYLPAGTTNKVDADRAAQRAVEALYTSDILLQTPEPGRYRISPIIMRLYYAPVSAQLFADVTMKLATIKRAFDLSDVAEFAADVFPARPMEARFGDLDFHASYAAFAATLHSCLGIGVNSDGAKALKLLARIQGGRQFATVDGLYKEMVLEQPRTFPAADRAVEHFADIQAAHDMMRTAEQQVEVLKDIPRFHEALMTAARG